MNILPKKEQIAEVKKEYEEPRPSAANDLDIANNEYKSYLGPQLFLEILLLKTRELAIKHSSAKRKEAKIEMETLEKEIRNLEKNITINKVEVLREKKERSETIRQKHMEGVMIRSCARWIERGEKASSYFCHLEKRNSCERRPNRDHGCHNDHRGNKDILHQLV